MEKLRMEGLRYLSHPPFAKAGFALTPKLGNVLDMWNAVAFNMANKQQR